MAVHQINGDFIRDFFGISDDDAGREEIAEIESRLDRLMFSNGEDICTIDDDPDGMFFLESGTALVLNREGEQINIMREGQYFGEYAVLARQKRLSTVRSLGKTIVYRLNNDDMMEILRRHPDIYGELMKNVYGQVSRKHSQIIALSRTQRGILQDPHNKELLSPKRIAIHYGIVALLFLLAVLFIPSDSAAPVFFIPLILMIAYALFTRRTLESLIIAGMMSAVLVSRSELFSSYTDSLMHTMGDPDNVFTVLVMALMGSVVELVEASGAVTAFRKLADRKIRTARGVRLSNLGILAVTAIDDCLNLLCAASALKNVSDEQKVPREDSGLLLSFLPTTLCSFLPFSLWGIFVIGTVNACSGGRGARLFCLSIPFNFFSIIVVLAMVLFCFDRLPRSKALRNAKSRAASGGKLWPDGSEKYLTEDDGEVWGKLTDLILPIVVLAVTSMLVRTVALKSFSFDSACGLVATLVFMFFLYCSRGLMSPEQFSEHLISGMQSMILPIVLYLLTMCFSTLLSQQDMADFFDELVEFYGLVSSLLPAALFLFSMIAACALGSSWAMFAIAFPIAVHMASAMGISIPLCVGAVCAAGIAGEKNCMFTGDSMSVANSIGCNPSVILSVRLRYSIAFTAVSFFLYLAAGFLAA